MNEDGHFRYLLMQRTPSGRFDVDNSKHSVSIRIPNVHFRPESLSTCIKFLLRMNVLVTGLPDEYQFVYYQCISLHAGTIWLNFV
jgi:hypothetical protein